MMDEFLARERKTLREKLRDMAFQLRKWADESEKGGWSTRQVEPMRKKADEMFAYLGKSPD